MLRRAAPLLVLLAVCAPARGADPLRCVPPSAQAVLVADSPRKLVEAVTTFDAFQKAQQLPQLGGLYESAAVKRGLQTLALFEKQLGAKWPELLDQLAGDGAALGFQFADDPAPALLVLQGKDEAQVKKALDAVVGLIEAETARQGGGEKVKWSAMAGHPSAKIGDARVARVGPTVLLSNNETMLKAAVILAATAHEKPHKARRDAATALSKGALAWLWVDLASVKQSKSAMDFFDSTKQDFLQTLILGGTLDCLKRADFVAAGLYRTPKGFTLSVRIPAGRDRFPPEYVLHAPAKGKPGTLPLLEPPGTLYSHGLYLDIGAVWKHRATLLTDEVRGGLEQAEKDISRVLPGSVKFGELLAMWGPNHRVVVANHDRPPYKTQPGLKLPAFGYVASGGDPKFAKAVEPAIRSGALIATLQFGMKMSEHEHDGVKIVAYRFAEGKELSDDPDGLRYNFEPCFAVVGEELVVASTVELCKKLITELKSPKGKPGAALLKGRFHATGAADALAALPDPLITEAILSRGVGLEAARKEVAELVAFVRTLGTVGVELDITDTQYKFDLVWELRK